MPGKSCAYRTKLAVQNEQLMALFETAGHEYIEPEIIQPADVFLERTGEDLRSRTYVFSDPEGNELCLRPDITVPTCRYHLATATTPQSQARYCYNGPAFRHTSANASTGHPREFGQLGLEWFGADNAQNAEAEIFNLTIAAMEKAGLTNYTVRIGDLGLFRSLLSAMDMPDRWRRRLAHEFWRPLAFHKLLRHLTGQQPFANTSSDDLVATLAAGDNDANAAVESVLDENNWALVPGRSGDDIARRLAEKASDKNAMPLSSDIADIINAYLNIHGPLDTIMGQLSKLDLHGDDAFARSCTNLSKRFDLFDIGTVKNGSISFAAEFGRSLEYYTGFVFQIEVDDNGAPLVIAGGGRYDDLIADIGKCVSVPAVGCAIYGERLLDAVERQNR